MKLLLEEEKTRYDGMSRSFEKLKKDSGEEIEKLKKFSMLLVEEKQAQNKKDERYLSRLKTAESEIVELEETLETLLKKFENEQEHTVTGSSEDTSFICVRNLIYSNRSRIRLNH